ncbi:hypothetical protein WICPIJ_003880 [Wickerhamomyces pijperi]|uniref:Uncharacterized protein n=1 Tax=Wickerhamomyces pijperi TaxID=599730 RepID=A0A9P8TMK2_WICPI|nr:hypothetical protein WICPIJ_003880 [Wickerhamomyces pijperi]
MRRKQTKSTPSLVNGWVWNGFPRNQRFKTRDIMRPEPKPRKSKGQPTSDSLSHSLESRLTITTPMNWELLTTNSSGSSEQSCLVLTQFGLQNIPNCLVVQVCVLVVQRSGRFTTVVLNTDTWNTFTEISLERVNTQICLIRSTVQVLDVIALSVTFSVDRRFLSDVRVDPNTDLDAKLFLQLSQHLLWVREELRIELEITPLETFHPETIEMEERQRNITVKHTFDERADRVDVIVCGERSTQP